LLSKQITLGQKEFTLNDWLKTSIAIVTNASKTYSFGGSITVMKRYKDMLERKGRWKEQRKRYAK